LSPDAFDLWWAKKRLAVDMPLSKYVGTNERTKIVLFVLKVSLYPYQSPLISTQASTGMGTPDFTRPADPMASASKPEPVFFHACLGSCSTVHVKIAVGGEDEDDVSGAAKALLEASLRDQIRGTGSVSFRW
jgi:hypothetical protein